MVNKYGFDDDIQQKSNRAGILFTRESPTSYLHVILTNKTDKFNNRFRLCYRYIENLMIDLHILHKIGRVDFI